MKGFSEITRTLEASERTSASEARGPDPDKLAGIGSHAAAEVPVGAKKAEGRPDFEVAPVAKEADVRPTFDLDRFVKPVDRVYLDDRGEPYRIGDKLLSGEFKINDYLFTFDDRGRTVRAEGKLQLKDPAEPRRPVKESMDAIGRGDQREGDDKGHLIADRFEGPPGSENLVAMDGRVNKSDYKRIENRLASELQAGKEVFCRVDVRYEGDSHRPSEFVVMDRVDGEVTVTVVKNQAKDA